jgi:hypothetical protein
MFGIKLFGSNRNSDPKVDKYGLPKTSVYDRAWTGIWDAITFLPSRIFPVLPYKREENEQFETLERDYTALGRDKFIEMYKSTGYAYYLLPKFLKKKDRELGKALLHEEL